MWGGGVSPYPHAGIYHGISDRRRRSGTHPLLDGHRGGRVGVCAAEEAGADALSLINTLLGMAIDIHTRQPKLANVTGGLSGPAIRPVAVRMVWQVAKAVDLPVIGMGGIMTAEDALEFIIAGARAVAVGTANFVNPLAAVEIVSGIKNFMIQNNIGNINNLVGSLQKPE